MTELQKITIRANPWRIPSAEHAMDDWLEGKEEEVAPVALAGNTNGGNEAKNKPALHLMPGTGITVDMIGKMFKAITGKDMTTEDRANCEAKLAAHQAKEEAGL